MSQMMEILLQDYYAIPPAERKATEDMVFTSWDLNFLDVDLETLCELAMVRILTVFIFPRSCHSASKKFNSTNFVFIFVGC